MRRILNCLALSLAIATGSANATETYDLIFKTGTLSGLPPTKVLEYDRAVEVPANAEMTENSTGLVKLTFEPEDMARLMFYQGEKHRNIASFPATVGNPMIMYFVETVIRDMAQNAGGSPFYIRNRVKEALITDAPVLEATRPFADGEVAVQQITLHPFRDDRNSDRMQGYDKMALTITMSPEVPGWYYSLVAEVSSQNGGAPLYRNALTLLPEDAPQ